MTYHYHLPRNMPESQGVSSAGILSFLNAVEQDGIELHSLMLLRHGYVITEGWWSPYSPDRNHQLYSVSKSFTSTAIGLAVNDGLLSVDEKVLSFFPERRPKNANRYLEMMRVHHLLSMSTGHLADPIDRIRDRRDGDWIMGFFAVPPDQEPGTVFTYNNAATFMLSAILQNLTGMKLVDYLKPHLFELLGITNTFWYENPQGINLGFSGLHITTEAIAKFGQLYLHKGNWYGKQLIPKGWVEKATQNHISTNSDSNDQEPDWEQGYGYQFWHGRHNSYRGDGIFGQFCLVLPEQDAVLATTAGFGNMQAILDLVWKHLLPALNPDELASDRANQEKLSRQLEHLAIHPTLAKTTSPTAAQVSGRTYDFRDDPNAKDTQQMTLHFHEDNAILVVMDDQGENRVQCGYNQWYSGRTTFFYSEEVPVMSSGAWLSPDLFSMEIRYIQTPHCLTLEFHFDGATLKVDGRWNVMLDSTEWPMIKGYAP